MPLTDTEVRIVSLVDQRFWETGGLVTNDKIATDLKISENLVKNAWKKSDFRQALVARGVDLTPESSKDLLTPTQILLANLLLNIGDKRSVREKCELAGISMQQYTAWLRQPAFAGYLRKRAESAFSSADFQAYTSLVNLVEEGDFNGLKLFFEMRGIYNPKMQVDVNIELVVVKVIEIVAKHVTDPQVLEAIANEIATVDIGSNRPVGELNVLSTL